MAETIARAFGMNKTSRTEANRLGTVSAVAQANTRRTFTQTMVKADGSGSVKIERTIDGKRVAIAFVEFGPEGQYDSNVIKLFGVGSMVPMNDRDRDALLRERVEVLHA